LLDLQLSEPPLSSLRPAVKRTHACGGAKVYIIDIKICLYIYVLRCIVTSRIKRERIVGVDGALEKASLHLPCITESYAPSSPSHLTVCHQVALSLSSLSVFVEREREHAHEQLTHHFLLCCSITGLGDGSFS
jgi:hypothetical protein